PATARPFTGGVTVDADGFLAIEPVDATGAAGTRRLIGITAVPDRAPAVRMTAPGRDPFLPDADPTLDLAVPAEDGYGLATLRLHVTRVSGFGEQFTFVEGTLPLAVTRTSTRHWTATARLPLDTLGLEPGDMVVYRAVAADRRPEPATSESDAYVI